MSGITSSALEVGVERLANAQDLPLPAAASEHAAGHDLYAAVPAGEAMSIEPGHRALIPTGIRIALPLGYEAQVRPRSGLAWRHGITVLNTPGTIDSDYRGEIAVVLVNLSDTCFVVERGMRIAQMIVSPVLRVVWRESVVSPQQSQRGSDGFGSTGTKKI